MYTDMHMYGAQVSGAAIGAGAVGAATIHPLFGILIVAGVVLGVLTRLN